MVGLGSELAPILSLEMAAGDVQAHRSKHVTLKPVTVQNFMLKLSFSLLLSVLVLARFESGIR